MTTTQAPFPFRPVPLIDRFKPSMVKNFSFAPVEGKWHIRFNPSQGLIVKAATTFKEDMDLGIQVADLEIEDKGLMQVKGSIDCIEVTVGIDSGATNNFIRCDTAKLLNLHGIPHDDFTELIGGMLIRSPTFFCDVQLLAGDFRCCVDLLALSVNHGPEIILGMPWLQKLGKITTDYSSMVMEFCVDGKQFRITSCAGVALNSEGSPPPPAAPAKHPAANRGATRTSGVTLALWDKLRDATNIDEILGEIKQKLIENPNSIDGYTLQDGCVSHWGRIVVPKDDDIRKRLSYEFHDMPVWEHSGSLPTFHRMRQIFKWEGMQADIRRYVQHCYICKQNKFKSRTPRGPIEPLPKPRKGWTNISMDLIDGLPRSGGFDSILVIGDCCTKYAHFIALSHPYTPKTVADAFGRVIIRLHGIPESIVSDIDPVFLSLFRKELFKCQQTHSGKSLTYHPRTDIQKRVVNRTLEKYLLEQYLRCFASSRPNLWERFIAWAEYWYNTTYHKSIHMKPFEGVYGRPSPHLRTYVADAAIAKIDQTLLSRDEILGILKDNLAESVTKMKHYRDRNWRADKFEVGDWVYLKLPLYRQSSFFRRAFLKLTCRFFGPFRVLEHLVGTFAYHLDLPTDSKIHPIFHESLLKKRPGDGVVATCSLPPYSDDGLPKLVPTNVLDYRWAQGPEGEVREALVHWYSLPEDDATWEPVEHLRSAFPELNLVIEAFT